MCLQTFDGIMLDYNCCTFNGLTERFLFQVLPRSRKDDGEDKDEEWWSSALGDGKTVVSSVHSICKCADLQIWIRFVSDSLSAREHITQGGEEEETALRGET